MNETKMRKKMAESFGCAFCKEKLTLSQYRKDPQSWFVCWLASGDPLTITEMYVTCQNCRKIVARRAGTLCLGFFDLDMPYFAGLRSVWRLAEYVGKTTETTLPILREICFNAQGLPTYEGELL